MFVVCCVVVVLLRCCCSWSSLVFAVVVCCPSLFGVFAVCLFVVVCWLMLLVALWFAVVCRLMCMDCCGSVFVVVCLLMCVLMMFGDVPVCGRRCRSVLAVV